MIVLKDKTPTLSTTIPCSSDSSSDPETLQWSQSEENPARRKVDCTVLTLLMLGLLVFLFDRMNLASALTDGFAEHSNLNQDTINLGSRLLFLGTVALEIPSNVVLQKLGPRKWISSQIILFGLVRALQILITNPAGYLASGSASAWPSIYTTSTWYIPRECARRVAVFFIGMFGGSALSSLLVPGILKLGGLHGLRGWQWLFLLEGLFTFCVAGLFFLLPGSPGEMKPLVGKGVVGFSERDRGILRGSEKAKGHIPLAVVWKTVKYWKRAAFRADFLGSFGFDRITVNTLTAVGAALAPLVALTLATISDATNKRGLAVIAGQLCYLVSLVVGSSLQFDVGTWGRWGLWTVINAFSVGYHLVHNTWLQLNCHDAEERSISIAMWVMSANTGMIIGTWYYRAIDKPGDYHTGLLIQIMMVSPGLAAALV
ncbi:inner membrane transporter yfaV [Triangularia setosa]|uniref:Inner membrane transporter yfaV n=1 Tax=Triangularia setosa TaxID=2587417 RepID=A0AAN6WA58_9PEZI|nr:inner membrane transporter yfaV [Podospora setosa]